MEATAMQAIDHLGFGRFQWLLLLVCGAWWAADAMEVMLMSFIMPVLKDEWGLDGFGEGSIGSCVFLGIFIGTFVWGVVSDNWGRKKGYLAVCIFSAAFGLASAFAPNLAWMIIFRSLLGFGIGGKHNIFLSTSSKNLIMYIHDKTGAPVAFSMFSEFLPTKSRGWNLVIFEVFWVVGTLLEAGMAWIILPRIELGWRWLMGLSAVPFIVLSFLFPLLPESPRYLLIRGRRDEAHEVLKRVARHNKKQLPPGNLTVPNEESVSLLKVLQLFKPSLRRLTIVLWFLWFAHSIVYYGLVLFTPMYFMKVFGSASQDPQTPASDPIEGGSPSIYLLVFITTMGELPGLLFSGILVDRIGRKLVMTVFMAASGVCMFAMLFDPSPYLAIIFLLGGRMFVNGSWAAAWTYTPEAYPTVVRATGLGAANGLSKFASIFTPYISTILLDISPIVPILLFGGTALAAAALTFALPFDTSRLKLTDSISNQEESALLINNEADTANVSDKPKMSTKKRKSSIP